MSASHYTSPSACKKCGGFLRYVSTQACVACAKRYVKDHRAGRAKLLRSPTTLVILDDPLNGDDLL